MRHARADYNRIQDPENKIPEEEPVFVLRGQDKYAAAAVAYYAKIIADDPKATVDALRCSAASSLWADEMRDWGKHKSPDMP